MVYCHTCETYCPSALLAETCTTQGRVSLPTRKGVVVLGARAYCSRLINRRLNGSCTTDQFSTILLTFRVIEADGAKIPRLRDCITPDHQLVSSQWDPGGCLPEVPRFSSSAACGGATSASYCWPSGVYCSGRSASTRALKSPLCLLRRSRQSFVAFLW